MGEEFKRRTKTFALRVLKLAAALPRDRIAEVIAKQVVKAGTSVGANYRAACRAKSRADFINKLKVVEEECDETLYWIELLEESGLISCQRLKGLKTEATELLAMTVASIVTARANRTKRDGKNPD